MGAPGEVAWPLLEKGVMDAICPGPFWPSEGRAEGTLLLFHLICYLGSTLAHLYHSDGESVRAFNDTDSLLQHVCHWLATAALGPSFTPVTRFSVLPPQTPRSKEHPSHPREGG